MKPLVTTELTALSINISQPQPPSTQALNARP
jgi:hypothetical protein